MRQRIARIVCAAAAAAASCAAAATPHWVATWSASPDGTGTPFHAQSIREIVRISIGGSQVRIHLSNQLGTMSVRIGPVHVGLHAQASAIKAGSDRAVSFGGEASVTLAAGSSALSDPIDLTVAPLQELAVSLYFPEATGPSSHHILGWERTFVTESGDATGAVIFPDSDVISSRPYLSDIEVAADAAASIVVAFGDSITDVAASTPDKNRRWPDVLATRLHADPRGAHIGVINAGITGNRILHDKMGPSALSRFERDALDKPGARWVILLEGVNDIGFVGLPAAAADDVSAQQIEDGMKELIARTHQRGLKIMGGTITPFAHYDWPYHTRAGEAKRQAVNAWIRTAGAFDATVDFDRALRDPAHDDRLRPIYDSGDHIHPNDAGCAALANAVDLKVIETN